MSDFKKLGVWEKAHELALGVDRAAAAIRPARYASLKNQMVRAAMSIPTNIVEGCGQESRKEFARFLRYGVNSASELEYHLIVARDIRVIDSVKYGLLTNQTIEVRRMLIGLIRRVSSS